GERLVLVVGDDDRGRLTLLDVLRSGVERLAEFHDVDATLTKRRSDRGRRRCRTRGYLELELARYFLSHSLICLVLCRHACCGRRLQLVVRNHGGRLSHPLLPPLMTERP